MTQVETQTIDSRTELCMGGVRSWWDVAEKRFVQAATVYLPQGCPDWGAPNGLRNKLCTFCSLPNAVAEYEQAFFNGERVPHTDQVHHFKEALCHTMALHPDVHTLFVFNAGSFLAEVANPKAVWEPVLDEIVKQKSIRRLVVESRAVLMTRERIEPLVKKLQAHNIALTIRIGVETQNDYLRLKVLRKGHSRKQLEEAVAIAREYNVAVGAYVLLKPSLTSDLRKAIGNEHASSAEVEVWSEEEARATLDWVLDQNNLGMDEAYFGATCVAEGAPLQQAWSEGTFTPPNLSSVFRVLMYATAAYDTRIHLLPMEDVPKFIAVPSNHIPKGLPEDLSGAEGCDRDFHEVLNTYRATMDHSVLIQPACKTCIS